MKKISERATELMVERNKRDLIAGGNAAELELLRQSEAYAGCVTWHDYMLKNASGYPKAGQAGPCDILAALDEYQAEQEAEKKSRNREYPRRGAVGDGDGE